MPQRSLPEVAIDAAPPDILRVFDEIAHLSGIPLPALIWRHLATFPGVLQEVWHALAPLYRSGRVQEAAWHAVRATLVGKAAGPDASQLSACEPGVDLTGTYRAVLQSYNRANPVNFVGVRLLLAAAEQPQRGNALPEAEAPTTWVPPSPIINVVPMVPVTEIPGPVRALIDDLAVARSVDRTYVVPSLYRHLVPWPRVIAAIHDELRPRIASGEVLQLVDAVTVSLQAEADALAGKVGPLPLVARTSGAIDALRGFSGLIPEMVVVGALLEHALDGS